jgi:hypothetical protein
MLDGSSHFLEGLQLTSAQRWRPILLSSIHHAAERGSNTSQGCKTILGATLTWFPALWLIDSYESAFF